ncbi:PREDICTED: guanine nucleotide-binding protein-like 1 isoform X1 [Wasmannia auropunctata]|uniref:guanine nucleotide-binding protein-like 1 isoform X1 n=2 Tax=Wasmannia auropunctata TaxID=64793 RepID=UPI0005EED0AD|nr:PREDICTED: guanine nucleotide-binding protein-like 1 isoform X1 [Wasmannia auropunctata]
MPQGRRKIPFSGKAKKQQMQAKKQRQRTLLVNSDDEESHSNESNVEHKRQVMKINEQPSSKSSRNKYALQFFQESSEKLRKRKERAFKSIEPASLKDQEISDNYFPPGIDMPKRPPWDFNMTKEQLELREQRYFTEYLNSMEELASLSYFELNLETWRQLWRVLEMSDMLLIIVDIRYPVLMFPPYLYDYVTKKLKKDMILVLNKVDLAPPALVVAWKEYFHNQYPKLHILMFTSYPTYNLRGNTSNEEGVKKRSRRGKLRMAAEGAQKLLEACKDIVGDKVDLSSWYEKIREEMHSEYDLDDINHKDDVTIEKEDTTYFKHEKYKNGVLTIGCVGTPNVGKSSLMNALMGKKVVSVSRTPGHTKHFQTIYLTKTVCLCDCPGLVFPSTVPKELQILMGSFPIAQVREPYTVVQFLAERVNLPKLLRIPHPENDDTWSAMDICDGWAIKRDFKTARAARLDTYRAANSLLRMTLEGKICLYIYPPNWTIDKKKWENHADVETVRWIQARNKGDNFSTPTEISSEDEETDDERLTEESSRCATNDNSNSESSNEENDVPLVANKFSLLSAE